MGVLDSMVKDVSDRAGRVLGHVAVDSTVLPSGAAADGTDGTGITPPTGGTGIRGWLSGIYARLGGTLTVSATALPLPTGAATETTLAAIKADVDKLPTNPAAEHTTAASPHAVRVSNGAAFITPTTPADTQPVSAASLPLPTGAATEAGLGTDGSSPPTLVGTGVRGWLRGIYELLAGTLTSNVSDRSARLLGHVTVDNLPGTQPISGTVAVSNFPATQPVSATALPLPSGAATSAAQTDGSAKTQIVQGANTLAVDSSGQLAIQSGGLTGSAVPTRAVQVGGTDGTLLRGLLTDTAGRLQTNQIGAATLTAGTLTLSTTAAALGGTLACSAVLVQADPANTTNVLVGSSASQTLVLTPGGSVRLGVSDRSQVWAKAVSGTPTLNYLVRS